MDGDKTAPTDFVDLLWDKKYVQHTKSSAFQSRASACLATSVKPQINCLGDRTLNLGTGNERFNSDSFGCDGQTGQSGIMALLILPSKSSV